MHPILSVVLYLSISCTSVTAELSYASSRKIVADTLQPDTSQLMKRQVVEKMNADSASVPVQRSTDKDGRTIGVTSLFKPVVKPDSPVGLIASGLGAILAFILGLGLIGGRSTYAGEILYPLGIIFLVMGGLFVTLFVVTLNRRNRALRQKGLK